MNVSYFAQIADAGGGCLISDERKRILTARFNQLSFNGNPGPFGASKHGPLNPGRLHYLEGNPANTFRGAKYTSHTIKKPMVLYRCFSKGQVGRFFSTRKFTSASACSMEVAQDHAFQGEPTHIVKIVIPAGTTIHFGRAASQPDFNKENVKESIRYGHLLGGGRQIFIENPDPKWFEGGHVQPLSSSTPNVASKRNSQVSRPQINATEGIKETPKNDKREKPPPLEEYPSKKSYADSADNKGLKSDISVKDQFKKAAEGIKEAPPANPKGNQEGAGEQGRDHTAPFSHGDNLPRLGKPPAP